ncbi:hypothetical protein [Paenibacillus sedimenti]|uniref:Uncharacterized protein n=1 Tax=Paenibacillus sedimenti TaxID=2770274 RepID=A0A926KPS8_9BACL|nr:hypothetical protein [Paenibacillus sedimenti]MBD0380706.1 hypothetical protein [Paenibacillus sedimenti]
MKKYIAFLVVFAVFALAAYQDWNKGQDQEQVSSIQGLMEMFSIDDVKAAMQKQGVELIPSEFNYKWFKLGLKTEYSFDLNGKEQLYVYVFDSTAEVERGLKQINNQNALYDIAHTPTPFMAKNILIMYMRYLPIIGLEDKIQAAVDTLKTAPDKISDVADPNKPPIPFVSANNKKLPVNLGSYEWMGVLDAIFVWDQFVPRNKVIVPAESEITVKFEYEPYPNHLSYQQVTRDEIGDWKLSPNRTPFKGSFKAPKEKGIYAYIVYSYWNDSRSADYAFAVEIK